MEPRGTHCSWCKKPKNQWNSTFRWWSIRGKSYCSARCFAAAEYQAHVIFGVCSVPILLLVTISLAELLLSETTSFYLGVSLLIIGIVIAFTGVCVYMVVVGIEERGKMRMATSLTRF